MSLVNEPPPSKGHHPILFSPILELYRAKFTLLNAHSGVSFAKIVKCMCRSTELSSEVHKFVLNLTEDYYYQVALHKQIQFQWPHLLAMSHWCRIDFKDFVLGSSVQ